MLALCSPALGADWWSTSEECYRVESQFSHFDEALVALIASSLQLSAPDWSCFRQSAHSTTAPLLYGLFMLFVVILLLNMLIAMMAETYSKVSEQSFTNYAQSFAGLLVTQRCPSGIGSTTSPLNLLGLPYYVLCILRAMARAVQDEVRSECSLRRSGWRV